MIPIEDDPSIREGRRGSFPMTMLGEHRTEAFRPENVSRIEGEAVEAIRSEEGVDPFAIGHRGGGCIASRLVSAFVRQFLTHLALPTNFPCLPVQRKNDESLPMRDRQIVVSSRTSTELRLRQGLTNRHGRGHDDLVFPHDGRRMPEAWKFCLPADVLFFRPRSRRLRTA